MGNWICIASKEHVLKGVEGGFFQVCHGKVAPLKQMKPNDWIIYYSPALLFGGKEPCRAFTAIGQIKPGEPYQFQMSDDFIPYRRDVAFLPARDVLIVPLLDHLSFISDKKRWGFPFRRGFFSIPESDFHLISQQMCNFPSRSKISFLG